MVCEPVAIGVASLGFFTEDALRLNPDVRLDSFDSLQGSYADQIKSRDDLWALATFVYSMATENAAKRNEEAAQ